MNRLIHIRSISTTSVQCNKKNFRKWLVQNKRGTRNEKIATAKGLPGALPIDHRGVRPIGMDDEHGRFQVIPEMVPELIVPDLTDCKLKPYVSYRTPDIVQSEFTSVDLFNAIYAPKIVKDFTEGKLLENGDPKEPSPEEQLTPEEALKRALKTGSDIM